ncbi:MAG: hypothetical protein ACRC6I_20910 [Paracoccaceae bacterium]
MSNEKSGKQTVRSGTKWFFLSFLLGCVVCIVLRATEVIGRLQISGNSAQQGGADIALILMFGVAFGVIGLLFAKLGKKG